MREQSNVHVSMPDCETLVNRCQRYNAVGPSSTHLQTAAKCSTTFTTAYRLLGYRLDGKDDVSRVQQLTLHPPLLSGSPIKVFVIRYYRLTFYA